MHLGKDISGLRYTTVDKDARVLEANVGALNPRDEAVLKDCLCNGDKNCTSQTLEELDAGCADWDPFLRKHCLNNDGANLKAGANAETGENLVAEPFAEWSVDVESGNEACTNGEEHHARYNDILVHAKARNQRPRDDGADDGGEQQRENLDASLDGTHALDCLEIQGLKESAVDCC